MSRVICAGHVNWDVTLVVDSLPAADGEACIVDQYQSGGGSAANAACALAALELDPVVLGSVGDDDYGCLARDALDAGNVDTSHLVTAAGETAVKYLLVDDGGEVAVLGNDGTNESFEASDLPADELARADHLHLTGQRPATARDLADRARDANVTVSVDPGRRIEDRTFDPVLQRADLVFLNEREAAAVSEADPGAIGQPETVVVYKRGEGGADVYAPDGRFTNHDGFSVDACDTAGAGDAFAAGFLACFLDTDGPPDFEECLAVANACGAIAASVRGARADLSWDAIDSFRDRS